MNLTAHYLPFIKSAPAKVLRVLGLAAFLAVMCGGLDASYAAEAGPHEDVPARHPALERRAAQPADAPGALSAPATSFESQLRTAAPTASTSRRL
jgi:hypothetical protein